MTCSVCGAAVARHRTHCVICGFRSHKDAEAAWDRVPEAMMYEELSASVETGEAIMACTRGRIVGTLRARAAFSPQRLFTPFINLGLTEQHLIVQHINPLTGLSVAKPILVKLATIRSITASDSDPIEPERTTRLVITFVEGGESVRVRASGRMAKAATALCEVWQAIANRRQPPVSTAVTCAECGREMATKSKFCPFCGKPMGDE